MKLNESPFRAFNAKHDKNHFPLAEANPKGRPGDVVPKMAIFSIANNSAKKLLT